MLLGWIASIARAECPPGYSCVDAAIIKAHVAAASLTLDGGQEPARTAWGVDLGYGGSILSKARWKSPGVALRDDFWLDLLLGKRTSDPLSYYDDPEGGFAVGMDSGYVALVGYQAAIGGIFAGTGIRYQTIIVGGSSNFDGSKPFAPLAVRADLHTGELRWKAFAWTNTRFTRPGVRFDIPFASTAWVSGSWTHLDAPVALASDDVGVESGEGGSILTIGLRVAAME